MAAEIDVWNPSFDVTPAALIEGIITEHGMVPRPAPGGPFAARQYLQQLGLLISRGGSGGAAAAGGQQKAAALATPPGA